MEVRKMLARANNLFGMIKDIGTFYQKTTKILSLQASEEAFANCAFHERPEVHESHMLQVELRRALAIAEFQRQSPR
jgi:hypothetical protein